MLFRVFTLVAMLALAVSTWILSSPGRRPAGQGEAKSADLPGYYLKDAVLTEFDGTGKSSIRIEAGRIDQIDHSSDVVLHHVRVNYQAPNGQDWVMVGDDAHVQTGGTVIDVTGNVQLQGTATGRQDAAVVHTDALRYDVTAAVASTESDVRVDFGRDTLTARGMVANLKAQTLRLESKVNGRFQP